MKTSKEENMKINRCINYSYNTAYRFSQILKSNINTVFQQSKTQNIFNSLQEDCFFQGRKSLYRIGYDGEYKRYGSITDASEDTGISMSGIRNVASGRGYTAGKYTFVESEKVETVDKQGNIEVNQKAINELVQLMNQGAMYAVDSEGN